MKISHLKFLPVISLLCLGLVVYSNTFHNSFHLDDYQNIIDNPLIRDIHNLHNIRLCGPPTRFITYLSLALNYQWNRLDIVGYHVFNLTVHLASTILVWWLVVLMFHAPLVRKEKIFSCSQLISFFVAAIFLAHPIQTQPVNYIIQRAVLLAAFFYLCSLCLYLKARIIKEDAAHSPAWKVYYTISFLTGVLAMFCKEMAVSLPLMVCFFEFFLFRGKKSHRWAMVAPFFLDVLFVLLPWMKTNVTAYAGSLTAYSYFLTQLKVLVIYLRLLFIPVHQSADYYFPISKSFFEMPVMLSALFLLLIFSAGVYCKNKFRVASVGIFWFFIAILPESSIIPISDVIFEHRLYLATLGFGLFLVSGIFYLFQNRSSFAVRILFFIVIGFSVLTYQRNKIWRDEFSLWDDVVHKSPQDQRAYLNRGAAYQRQGDLDHALADYNMVIGLGPVDAVTLSNRGNIFRMKGAFDLALANFNLAVKINPSYAGAYINRGLLYQDEGKFGLALADFNKEIELMPQNVPAYIDRAMLYESNAKPDLAIADCNKAIELEPNNPDGYGTRAIAYYLKGQYDKTWEDVHRVKQLGAAIRSEYLEAFKKASGRDQ